MDVTLGLVFEASIRKEWPMTFIAVRCPHCQSDQIVKRGKTARGTQRYLCQNTLCAKGSFLLDYCNRGCLPEVKQTDRKSTRLNSSHLVISYAVFCLKKKKKKKKVIILELEQAECSQQTSETANI